MADYRPPQSWVDATTRLCRTSLFMHGNRMVRAVEVTGDLGHAMQHVAAQPDVRAVEDAINPHLEEARDFSDPTSIRSFFARAALPAVHHVQATPVQASSGSGSAGELTRLGFLYPVRPGRGAAAMRLFADLDRAAAQDPDPRLASSTLFMREDLLVRVVDVSAPDRENPADPAMTDLAMGELSPLLDPGQDQDLTTSDGLRDFLASCAMELITDRGTPD